MSQVDWNAIGQQRTFQDPQDAVKQSGGSYEDAVGRMPEGDRVLQTPKGAEPSPFGTLTDIGRR